MRYMKNWLFPFPNSSNSFFYKLGRSFGKRLRPDLWPKQIINCEAYDSHYDSKAKYFFENLEQANLLFDFIDNSISSGANWSDYLILYKYIIQKKPRAIIEFGAGVSTIVIALAVKKLLESNHKVRFESMESDLKYHKNLNSLVPEELSNFLNLNYSPRVESRYEGLFTASHYKDLPKGDFGFAFIDGPPAHGYCCSDLLTLLDRGNPYLDFISDRRLATVETLNRLFPVGSVGYDFNRHVGIGKRLLGENLLKKKPRLKMKPDHIDSYLFHQLKA